MSQDAAVYRFGDFTLHPAERQLRKGASDVILRPKAFETLLCLVRQHGRSVSKAQLLETVWPDVSISEAVLTHCIAEVRRALSDDVKHPRFVKTMSKHGYRFVGTIQTPEEPGAATRALREPIPPLPSPRATAIAVLPFANISADPENEYLCDGLSEELINGLTKVGTLQVVAHSSSFSFKGRDVDAREVGRQLNVGTILEGSVRRTGNRLRVSAQLIDAARGYHLWCEQYDRELEDVFAVEDEISQAILASLKVELLSNQPSPLIKRSTSNIDAYLLYLKGRAFWHRRFGGLLQKGMECFGQAIAKDPGFALPYTGLADSLATLGIWAFAPPRDVLPKAATLADTAQALDPALAEARASRSLVRLFWDWEWSEAERGFREALELNQGCATIHMAYGHYLAIVGRTEESITEIKRAQALDPLSPLCSANVGWFFSLAHQQDRAIEELLKVLAREPEAGIALFYLGYAYMEAGRYPEAIEAFGRAHAITQGMPWSAEGIGLAYGLAGNRDQALAVLAETRARAGKGYVPASALAMIHLGLGEDDVVLDCLERGLEDRDVLLPWLKHMPCFDRLHSHPRFQAILSRVRL